MNKNLMKITRPDLGAMGRWGSSLPKFLVVEVLHPPVEQIEVLLGEKSFKFELLEVVADPLVVALRAHQRHLLSDRGGDLVRVGLLHQGRLENLLLVEGRHPSLSWNG